LSRRRFRQVRGQPDRLELTDRDLNQDIRVVIPGRKNVVASGYARTARRGDASHRLGCAANMQLDLGPRFTEEGELLVPANFNQTAEEKKG
jgi:hypothetical protein